MSETETMTKQEILESFKNEFNSIIRNCERAIEKYSLGMNEDYEYFYRWHSGDMYKAVVRLRFFRALRPIIDCDSAEGIAVILNQHIGNIEWELIDGRQYPGGSSLASNAAEILAREAKQDMRADLKRLLYAIEYKG